MLKRKVLTMLLALVLVVSMAIPSFAASYTESGDWGGMSYSRTISYNVSKATMTMTYGLHTANLTVQARATVVVLVSGKTAYGDNFYNTGKSTVSISTTNSAYDSQYNCYSTGDVVGARGNSLVGTNEYMGYIYVGIR